MECTNARFVEVEFPRHLRPRLVIGFSDGLSLLLEDRDAIPLAADQLGSAPARNALLVLTNKRHNRLKLLYFDGTGLWVAA